MKTLRYVFWVIVGLALILVGLANREFVTVRAMPEVFADFLGISPDISLPMFIVIFAGVGLGLLLGFLWEWIREHGVRAEARTKRREVDALRREVATLRGADSEKGEDIMALLDAPAR